jgi:hypothetical protein
MVEIEKNKVRNKKCSEETEQRHDTPKHLVIHNNIYYFCNVMLRQGH